MSWGGAVAVESPIISSYKQLIDNVGNNQTKTIDLSTYLPDETKGYLVLLEINFQNHSNSDVNSLIQGYTDMVGSNTNKITLGIMTAYHSNRTYQFSQLIWLPIKRYITINTAALDLANIKAYAYRRI